MFECLYCNGKFIGFRVSEENCDISFHQAPVLWNASNLLLQALKFDCPDNIPWKNQIKSVNNELNRLIQSISPSDYFARLILRTIPKTVLQRGIFPENALKARFNDVEKLARRMELVPENGASLLVYVLSYFQSVLLFRSTNIPQTELNDQVVDFSKLNTCDILNRAKFWLNRGDFLQSLKYMNLLKGAPRSVASEWMNEVKIWLETQQAAKILMSHAAYSSIKYL